MKKNYICKLDFILKNQSKFEEIIKAKLIATIGRLPVGAHLIEPQCGQPTRQPTPGPLPGRQPRRAKVWPARRAPRAVPCGSSPATVWALSLTILSCPSRDLHRGPGPGHARRTTRAAARLGTVTTVSVTQPAAVRSFPASGRPGPEASVVYIMES